MTSDDIHILEIEKILLPEGTSFDDERRKFIFENSKNIDLVACAGSGKTTALLAKLLLLERQQKAKDGICVLTHTNVAINEIKDKISSDSILLQFPSSFSTIQQFVDRFLTIPAYRHLTGHNLKQIDTEAAQKRFVNYLYTLPNSEAKQALFNYRSLGLKPEDRRAVLERGVEYLIKPGTVGYFQFTGNYGDRKIVLKNPNAKSYQVVKKAKDPVFFEGYITYDEAYSLAFWYLDKFPFIQKCLAERFKFVFVDEMQDSSQMQIDLLERIFKNPGTIYQRIGDPNQTIYDTNKDSLCDWSPTENLHSLKGSLRLSTSTVEAISGIRNDCTELIKGNENLPKINPYIITFREGDEHRVLDTYKEVLRKHWHELDYKKGDMIKVVGWTGVHNKGDLSLLRYNPSFSNSTSKKYLPNFESYKSQFDAYIRKQGSLKASKSLILQVAAQLLFELRVKNENKYYSQSEVEERIESDSELNQTLLNLSVNLAYSENTWDKVIEFILNKVLPLFVQDEETIDQDKLNDFLRGESVVSITSEEVDGTEDFLAIEGLDIKVPIITSTIHAVKGETHKSTLYVETKYYKYDLECLLLDLCGGLKKKDKLDGKRKMMGYVAMSRASHLLCLAVRDAVIDQNMEKKLLDIGWQVIRV